MWAVSRVEAEKRAAIHEETTFSVKVMMCLGVCGQGLSVLVIFEDGSMDTHQYVNEVLPITLASGNRMLGNDWKYQQDDTRPHAHHLSQKWCADHFPSIISKDW